MAVMTRQSQTIRYLTAADGTRLAWASSGTGASIVKASNWITHLEYDWESPVWSHWIDFFSAHFRLVRYDERGNGLSQHDVADVSSRNWLRDLESVVETAKPQRPFVLLGISQGSLAAIEYAVKHPEHVSQLVLYGGYARGWALRDDPEEVRRLKAIVELTELGWGSADPVFRRLYTSRFLPDGTEEQLHWFDELCARTASPKMAARLIVSRGHGDVRHLLSSVAVPTLVAHAVNDQAVPFFEGQELAAEIPGAQFLQLDSSNHILLSHEPAWARLQQAVVDFTGVESQAEAAVFALLSPRERDILGRLLEGMTNVDIGKALFISEKTVRNHITKIYEKLGVKSRSQAIVLARDQGFSG